MLRALQHVVRSKSRVTRVEEESEDPYCLEAGDDDAFGVSVRYGGLRAAVQGVHKTLFGERCPNTPVFTRVDCPKILTETVSVLPPSYMRKGERDRGAK